MTVEHNETAERPDSNSVLTSLQVFSESQEKVVLLRSLRQQLFGDRTEFSVDGRNYNINVRRSYHQESSSHPRIGHGTMARPFYMVSVAMIPEGRRPRKEDVVIALKFDPYRSPESNLALIDDIGGGANTPEHANDMQILDKGLARLIGARADAN